MNRFKRIAHGGWLGRFLSVVTRGYYPYADVDVGPVDWCVAHSALYRWLQTIAALYTWSTTLAARYVWSTSTAPVATWTQSAAPAYAWSYQIEVICECCN